MFYSKSKFLVFFKLNLTKINVFFLLIKIMINTRLLVRIAIKTLFL